MSQRIPLSWLQLKHEKMKLFAAVAGVMVSVVLMWMQLGLMKALFASAVVFHGSMNGELVIAARTSPTNIAMALLSDLAAYDFGWCSVGRVADRISRTIDTLGSLFIWE